MVAEINRPKALNALNLGVVTCMNEKLAEWNKIESGVSCFIFGEGDYTKIGMAYFYPH